MLSNIEGLLNVAVDAMRAAHCSLFNDCRRVREEMVGGLHLVMLHVQAGRYKAAIYELQQVIPKTDGCAVAGVHDQDDRTSNRTSQAPVY